MFCTFIPFLALEASHQCSPSHTFIHRWGSCYASTCYRGSLGSNHSSYHLGKMIIHSTVQKPKGHLVRSSPLMFFHWLGVFLRDICPLRPNPDAEPDVDVGLPNKKLRVRSCFLSYFCPSPLQILHVSLATALVPYLSLLPTEAVSSNIMTFLILYRFFMYTV